MIPILYEREETLFNTNGIGRLADCISFTVTEERNGIYEAEFKYPITGLHFDDLQEGRIVYAIHDDTKTPQPFRIYGRSAPISGIVTFYAHHISYDLGSIVLKPFTGSSCADVISKLKNNAYTYCPFTFWTDKSVAGTWNLKEPHPIREMLGGTQGSLLDVYGTGEYEFDKWTVKLHVNRGTDTGIRIQYGKNLSDITHDTNYSGIYSAVVPYWQDSSGSGTIVTLPEQFIIAPETILDTARWTEENNVKITDENGNEFKFDYGVMLMTTMDMSDAFQDAPTAEQLRTAAQNRLNSSDAWLPNDNITIDFVQLWQTSEYANIAPLERLKLCDSVDVYYPALGIVARSKKIVKVVYDVLLERYDSMEIGTAKVSFAETVKANTEDVVAQNYPSKGMLADAIKNATAQITGEHGGYIKYKTDANGEPTELLIMDAPDEAQAVKIWRWNLNGLGYSRNSGQTYGLAITQDGAIVADFITAGTLAANLIKAGVLSDVSGKFSLDMQTGTLTMDSAQLTNANVSGDITANTLALGTNASVPYSKVSGKPDLTVYIQKDGTIGTTPAEGVTGFKVSSAGLLTASNAVIYGTVYASDGTFTGTVTAVDTHYKSKLQAGRLQLLYDDELFGRIGAVRYSGIDNAKGLDIIGDIASIISISLGGYTKFLVNNGNTIDGHSQVVQMFGSVYASGNAALGGTLTAANKLTVSSGGSDITGATKVAGNLTTTGNLYIQNGTLTNVYLHSYVSGTNTSWLGVYNAGLYIGGNMTATGTKSRAVDTDGFGTRTLYCYETPSPLFGDVGEGAIGDDGTCYVWIDPIFAETIRTSSYQVFLQKYGDGDAYVSDRKAAYFVVTGTPGISFGWELKAKQSDFAEKRLEKDMGAVDIGQSTDYGQQAADYLEELRSGRLAA